MGGFAIASGFLLLALIFGSGGSGGGGTQPKGGRDPDVDPKLPGTGPINPSPTNEGPPPSKNKGWGGGQYGSGPIPDDFDWGSSVPYISDDCSTIAEPLLFLPIPGSHQILFWWMPIFHESDEVLEQTQGSLAGSLVFVGPPRDFAVPQPAKGTAWGYIGRLVAEQQRQGGPVDPVEIATQVLAETIDLQEAGCDPMDPQTWPQPMRDWWENLVARIELALPLFIDRNELGAWECCDDDPGVPFNT